jgi:hypothetical protein
VTLRRAVEELATARPQLWDEVLDVGRRRGGGADRRRVERAAAKSERTDAHEAADDLEAATADVVVRHAVAYEVQSRPEQERSAARTGEVPGGGAGGDMQRDDHGHRPAR